MLKPTPSNMANNRKILLLFAHPSLHRSEVNIHLFNAACQTDNVTAIDLYREYPTHHIDVQAEQQRLLEHDVIIFQFPLYWYSTPAILKDWQDMVLEYGFAYGQDGNKLEGKTFLCATTAGAGLHTYSQDGLNHFTIRQLLYPLEQTATLCRMNYLPPFALFGSRTAAEEHRVDAHVEQWLLLLSALSEHSIDFSQVADFDHIGKYLNQLSGEHV